MTKNVELLICGFFLLVLVNLHIRLSTIESSLVTHREVDRAILEEVDDPIELEVKNSSVLTPEVLMPEYRDRVAIETVSLGAEEKEVIVTSLRGTEASQYVISANDISVLSGEQDPRSIGPDLSPDDLSVFVDFEVESRNVGPLISADPP